MLLYGHKLKYIVTKIGYTREYKEAKFGKSTHLLLFGGHTYMCLINQRRFSPPWGVNVSKNKDFQVAILELKKTLL